MTTTERERLVAELRKERAESNEKCIADMRRAVKPNGDVDDCMRKHAHIVEPVVIGFERVFELLSDHGAPMEQSSAHWIVQLMRMCTERPARSYPALVTIFGMLAASAVFVVNLLIGAVHGFQTGEQLPMPAVSPPQFGASNSVALTQSPAP